MEPYGAASPKLATLPFALASQYPLELCDPAMPVMAYPPGANAGWPSNTAFPKLKTWPLASTSQ